MVKLVYKKDIKQPKGPCVVVIHANWCGHCKTLMPKFENEIVESSNFNKELEGLLTLGSIEESGYDDVAKKLFGEVDGYPTIRYIRFNQEGKPMTSFDLPPNIPRESDDIIEWINDAVKNDAVKIKTLSKKTKTHHKRGGTKRRGTKKRGTKKQKHSKQKGKKTLII